MTDMDFIKEIKKLIRLSEAESALERIKYDEEETLLRFEKLSSAFQGAKQQVRWAAARTRRAEAALAQYKGVSP